MARTERGQVPGSPRLHRWGSAGGVAFVLLVVAWVALTRVIAATDAPNHVLDMYDDPSIRLQTFIGTVVLAIAAVCFLAFLSDLVTLLRRAGGADGPLPTLALAGGVGFIVLLLSAGCMFVVLPNLIAFDEVSDQLDPDIAAVTVQIGMLLMFAYASAAAIGMVLSTSIIGRQDDVLPRWLCRAGYVLSGLLLLGFSGPPFLLLLIWIASISIALRPRAPDQPPPQGQAFPSSSESNSASHRTRRGATEEQRHHLAPPPSGAG